MVERSFDPSEFGPDPSERARENRRKQEREAMMDQARREMSDRQRSSDRDDSSSKPASMDRAGMSRFQQASRSSVDKLAEIVNDPNIVLDNKMMKTINDPSMVMLSNGDVAKLQARSNQFSRANLVRAKPKRKKNPKLAQAMREANAKGRKKNGGFKKGYDQARIARLAQKILKRMK
jgi:hypothetical protein